MIFKVEDGTGYEDSNSYVDVSYADDYVAFYFPEDTSWDLKSVGQKELTLITGTKFVDRMVDWSGEIFKQSQALKWPRTEFRDVDGRVITAGTIPSKVKDAVVIMAVESLTSDIYDQGVLLTSQKYGSSSETYSGPVRDGGNRAALFLLQDFKALGFGKSSSSIITIYRA